MSTCTGTLVKGRNVAASSNRDMTLLVLTYSLVAGCHTGALLYS